MKTVRPEERCFNQPCGPTATTLTGLILMMSAHVSMAQGTPASVQLDSETDQPRTLPKIRVQDSADDDAGYTATRTRAGTKTDTPLIETPQSITVITRDFMNDLGATTLNEALGYTAGVRPSLYGFDDTRFDWVSIRGFDTYTPGFFQDGLLGRSNNTWAVWRPEPYGVERIEVLRGPASVLYGLGSPGGLINVVSKRPMEERLTRVELQVGRFDRYQAAADFSGPIDSAGEFLYRLTGLVRDSDTQVDLVENDRFFIAPSLTWRPSANTSLTLLTHYQDEKSGSGIGFLPAGGTLLSNPNGRIPMSRFTGEPDFDHFDKSQWAIGYLLEHQVNEQWSLRQNARYGEIVLDYKQAYGIGLDPSDPAQRILLRSAFYTLENVDALAVDNQIEASFTTGTSDHTLLMGLDYQRHAFDQRTGFGAAPPIDVFSPVYGQHVSDPPFFTDADITLEQIGVYVQEQAKLNERWVFVLGGRYDQASIETDDRLTNSGSKQDDNKFTGRAGLVYLSAVGLAPYVSYSESFFPTTGTDPLTGQAFEPESGQQYEAGVKYQPAGTNSFITVAAFDLQRQNYVTYDSNFIASQTGEIRSRGLELEAVMQLAHHLKLTGAYTWLGDFEITKSSNASEVGKRQPTVSEHMASLWMHYRLGYGALAGLGFGGGARYIGSSFGDGANSAFMKVPDYTLFDAALDYELDHWRFALNARNLTDKTYVASCSDTCYYGSSRSVHATLSFHW